MSAFHHPAFHHIVQRVPDDRDAEMVAAGWVPLLNPDQKKRLTELEDEVESQAVIEQLERDLHVTRVTPQTPPPAVRKPIGPGQVPKGKKHDQHRRQRPSR